MINHQTYIYPTDTVWGIGGSIYSEISYKEIARIKNTTEDKPLSILFSTQEELFTYFKFPNSISSSWLKDFFSFESSLLLPLQFQKKEIPSWIFQGSSFVSVRCLDFPIIHDLVKALNSPITTTSLNKTGFSPIASFEEAKLFYEQNCPQVNFVMGKEMSLSGNSSTMISLDDSGQFKMIRNGLYARELSKLCGLSST